MRTLLPLQLQDNSGSGVGALHQIPLESGSLGGTTELSETECDIDLLKKFKLGMRSSLWSRPSNTNTIANSDNSTNQQQLQHTAPASDYSIAV